MITQALILGMSVVIKSSAISEYYGCTGNLHKIVYIPELKETITVVKPVVCPNGDKYDYVVGIQLKDLQENR